MDVNKEMKEEINIETQKTKGSIHLLLAGHSTGHILKVIEEFRPDHIELFTSMQLEPTVNDLMSSIHEFQGTYHIENIPSFTEDSLISGISIISGRYKILKSMFPFKKIYFGITGGTNTMAVEIAITALFSMESMHYVVKDVDDDNDAGKIIMFDTEKLNNFLKTKLTGRPA